MAVLLVCDLHHVGGMSQMGMNQCVVLASRGTVGFGAIIEHIGLIIVDGNAQVERVVGWRTDAAQTGKDGVPNCFVIRKRLKLEEGKVIFILMFHKTKELNGAKGRVLGSGCSPILADSNRSYASTG